MQNYLLLFILLSPVIGAIILGLMYVFSIKLFNVPKVFFTIIGLSTPFISFVLTFILFLDFDNDVINYEIFKWIGIKDLQIYFGLMLDKISLFMTLFITFIAWLIHIYASSYMSEEEGYGKFFFYFNLFLASMLLLVLANNPIIMFIGWEGVGVCSYLLIGFYYKNHENIIAANKAFIANRVGDFGFIIGLCVLFYLVGFDGFDYISLKYNVYYDYLSGDISKEILMFIGFMLFVGAVGKSAQIPLYVWLPDAMAGPTPVSALIHAATMVTAGVYLIARFSFLYDFIPEIGLFIAYIGAFSSVFAAIIACKQSDIKKILAYSTMSQLGYMFIAVGLGEYGAGLFHVFTHAFFKALLFMSAGAVIIALHHEQDIFKMGGLKDKIPLVFTCFLIANLAISGIPPFAGFFSKDEILLISFAKKEYLIYAIGLFTAFLTAYYMFRLFFVVFIAKNEKVNKTHKLSKTLTTPLIILAIGSSIAGFLGVPEAFGVKNYIHEIFGSKIHINHSIEFILMFISIIAGILGIFVAFKKFANYNFNEEQKEGLVYNKFYIDEIYNYLIVQKLKNLSIIISEKADIKIIDGFIMNTAKNFVKLGVLVGHTFQNGKTKSYALTMMIGFSMFCIYILIYWRV